MKIHQIDLDAPAILHRYVSLTLRVNVKGLWRVRLGLSIIKIGARIAGVSKIEVK